MMISSAAICTSGCFRLSWAGWCAGSPQRRSFLQLCSPFSIQLLQRKRSPLMTYKLSDISTKCIDKGYQSNYQGQGSPVEVGQSLAHLFFHGLSLQTLPFVKYQRKSIFRGFELDVSGLNRKAVGLVQLALPFDVLLRQSSHLEFQLIALDSGLGHNPIVGLFRVVNGLSGVVAELGLVLTLVLLFKFGNSQVVLFADFVFDFEHPLKLVIAFVLHLQLLLLLPTYSAFVVITAVDIGPSDCKLVSFFGWRALYFLKLTFPFAAHAFELCSIFKFLELLLVKLSAVQIVRLDVLQQWTFIAVFAVDINYPFVD